MSGNPINTYGFMERSSLVNLLNAIGGARVVLIGDICLDAYWRADMTKSELSRETPYFPLPVVGETYSPGAGGNVAANIAALKPGALRVVSVTGDDWRGGLLRMTLAGLGIDTSSILKKTGRMTNAYCKAVRTGISDVVSEDPRIDFSNYSPLPQQAEDELIDLLDKAAASADVLCVCDQFDCGCITDRVRSRINELAADGMKVLADSRSRIALFSNAIIKPNELEGGRAAGMQAGQNAGIGDYAAVARALERKTGSKVCMTLGGLGSVYCEASAVTHIPAVRLKPPVDICGAGDTFLSMLACAIAAGSEVVPAIYAATLASGVTVKKVGQTGTANPAEILAKYDEVAS